MHMSRLKHCMAALTAVLLCAAFAVADVGTTVVFQEGVDSYAGTRDDQITMNWGAELNRGAATTSGFGRRAVGRQ